MGLSRGLAQRHRQFVSQSSVQGEKEAKYTEKREGEKWIHLRCLPSSAGSGMEVMPHHESREWGSCQTHSKKNICQGELREG